MALSRSLSHFKYMCTINPDHLAQQDGAAHLPRPMRVDQNTAPCTKVTFFNHV
jgi:hypothetical protein